MGKRWPRPYSSYRNDELVVVVLPTPEDTKTCLRLLWEDPILGGCPHGLTGKRPEGMKDGSAIFVPKEAVALLRKKNGLRFAVEQLMKPSDVSKDALARARHENGM